MINSMNTDYLKKYMDGIATRAAKQLGGNEFEENMEKHYKSYLKVVESDDFKDILAKCMNKNLDEPDKLKTILKSICSYKIKDFVIDLYKFPRNVKNLNEYAFSICIGIYLLVFIGIGILVKLIFFNGKSTSY